MTDMISDHSDPDPETIDRARAALSADDLIEKCRTTGIDAVEYARTKYGVDPAEHSSHRSLRKALYPDREAELAEREPSDAAKGAEMLMHLEGGKSFAEASREVSADSPTAALSSSERERATDLADSALLAADSVGVARNDIDPADYIREVYGVEPSEHANEYALRSELIDQHDTDVIRSRRRTLRQARKERENAELRDQVQREMDDRYGDPSAAQLSQGRARGDRTWPPNGPERARSG